LSVDFLSNIYISILFLSFLDFVVRGRTYLVCPIGSRRRLVVETSYMSNQKKKEKKRGLFVSSGNAEIVRLNIFQ